MAQYIDKSALVAEIVGLRRTTFTNFDEGVNAAVQTLLETLDSLEVKEVDLDALGILAEHLIACDAHGVTPNYTDKEFNLLEEWTKIIKH